MAAVVISESITGTGDLVVNLANSSNMVAASSLLAVTVDTGVGITSQNIHGSLDGSLYATALDPAGTAVVMDTHVGTSFYRIGADFANIRVFATFPAAGTLTAAWSTQTSPDTSSTESGSFTILSNVGGGAAPQIIPITRPSLTADLASTVGISFAGTAYGDGVLEGTVDGTNWGTVIGPSGVAVTIGTLEDTAAFFLISDGYSGLRFRTETDGDTDSVVTLLWGMRG